MKFVCEMNRMSWIGNPGPSLRRGEVFEMAEGERTETWLEQGYISVCDPEPEPELEPELVMVSEPEPEPEPEPEVEPDEEKLEEAPIGKAVEKKKTVGKKLKTAELPK